MSEQDVRNESGQYVEKHLPSDKAREMAKKKWEQRRKKKEGVFENELEQLLYEAGYATVEDAPLALKKLGEQIVQGGARSVQAFNAFIRETRDKERKRFDFDGKGRCPLCGRDEPPPFDMEQAKEDLAVLRDMREIRDYLREKHGITKSSKESDASKYLPKKQ